MKTSFSNSNVVSLAQISERIDYGYTASATVQPVGPKFLRITDIQNGQVDWSTVPYCQFTGEPSDKAILRDGDIVFARTGATTGKSYLIRQCPADCVFASYLIRVRPSERVNPKYLAHFFRTPNYWAQIFRNSAGTAQEGVNASKLKQLQVPLPDLEEQNQIADLLDQSYDIVDYYKRSILILDELLFATYAGLMGDPVRNTKSFPTVRIGDLTEVCTGSTPSRQEPANFIGLTPWVKTGEVDGSIIFTTEEFIADHVSSGRCRVYPSGSVLIAMYGQGKTLGKAAILGIPAATNQACAVLLPNTKYKPEYLLITLQLMYDYIRTLARGGNQPNLNLNIVRNISVPLPPIILQTRFAELFLQIGSQKQLHQKAISIAEELLKANQYSAFPNAVMADRDLAHAF